MRYKIIPEFKEKTIEELNLVNSEEIIREMHERGVYTVMDFIAKQKTLPQKYANSIKAKIIFGIDYAG